MTTMQRSYAQRTSDRLNSVKSKISLADVVGRYGVVLDGAETSRVRQAPCPFHDEAQPSFTVYDDSQRYYCFGCGVKGDAFDFVQAVGDAANLHQAIRRLAGEDKGDATPRARKPKARRSRECERDLPILRSAVSHYAESLLAPDRNAGSRYLKSRGVSRATAERLSLGYAPGGTLRDYLVKSGGYDPARVARSGLFIEGRERFAGMVVVPEVSDGGASWLTGRAVAPRAQPRFQALPGPKPPLLGAGLLRSKPKWVVLTEGVFDWLTLMQWEYPAAAIQGAAGIERIVKALEGVSYVLLAMDNDDAGRDAAERARKLLTGKKVINVGLPSGVADVADLGLRTDGRGIFHDRLVSAGRGS